MLKVIAGSFAFSMMAFVGAARATPITLPDATYSGNVVFEVSGWLDPTTPIEHYTNIPITGPTFFADNQTVPGQSSGSYSVHVTNTPSPGIFMSMHNNVNGENAGGGIDAQITYSMLVAGPDGFVPIQVNAQGGYAVDYGITSPNGVPADVHAQTQLNFGTGSDNTHWDCCSSGSGGFVEDGVYDFHTNQVYTVWLYAVLSGEVAGNVSGGYFTASLFLDPVFTIAASDPSLYSLQFSSGIGNSPAAVPLPAAFPLFASGLGATGLFLRRRRKRCKPSEVVF